MWERGVRADAVGEELAERLPRRVDGGKVTHGDDEAVGVRDEERAWWMLAAKC